MNNNVSRTSSVDSLYASVTDRIIAELEQGRVPWVQPWDSRACAVAMPHNAGTGRGYSGINILILWAEVVERGYRTQGWLTFNQARGLGGMVRKGEHGVTICYADRFTPKEQEGADEPRQIAFLKRFTVFNVDQCDGLPEALHVAAPPLGERETIPHAEALIAATGADIRLGAPHACYIPGADRVELPHQQAFYEQVNFYRTALHELGHWTGHASRLGRIPEVLGREAYAREELMAELASAFTCASLGIAPTVRHADYIGAWLEVLKADNRAIFRAASQASKAADYLLAFRPADGVEQ